MLLSYAAVAMATQWYQTANMVTASIKLKGIPPDRLSDITARFREQYCAVYVGGESPDEPMLPSSPNAVPPLSLPPSLLVCMCEGTYTRDTAVVNTLSYCIL